MHLLEPVLQRYQGGSRGEVLGVLVGKPSSERRAEGFVPWKEGELSLQEMARSAGGDGTLLAVVISETEGLDRLFERMGGEAVADLSWIVVYRGVSGLPRLNGWCYQPSARSFHEEMILLV
jgi:hypothetical protein